MAVGLASKKKKKSAYPFEIMGNNTQFLRIFASWTRILNLEMTLKTKNKKIAKNTKKNEKNSENLRIHMK